MRKYFLTFLFFFITTTYLNAQAQNKNEQENVHQTLTRFFNGFSTLDTIMVQQYSTKDFLLLEDGVVWNMDSIRTSFNQIKNQIKSASLTRINHFDFIQTEVRGNSSWVAYNNTADLTFNNSQKRKLQWIESAFLVKEGNEWKIKLLHSTMLKPKAQ